MIAERTNGKAIPLVLRQLFDEQDLHLWVGISRSEDTIIGFSFPVQRTRSFLSHHLEGWKVVPQNQGETCSKKTAEQNNRPKPHSNKVSRSILWQIRQLHIM